MDGKMDVDAYLRQFEGKYDSGSKQAKALELALDIRKFEIDLYWKRAAYFWTFIAAAFAGYAAVQTIHEPSRTEFSVVFSSIGFVFSFAWFCINRGSKYWQVNWETHVDVLEDGALGPLYKVVGEQRRTPVQGYLGTGLDAANHFTTGPAPFSVSKINQIISLFVVLVWGMLVFHALPPFGSGRPLDSFYVGIVCTSAIACVAVLAWGRTGRPGSQSTFKQRAANLQSK